MRRDDNTKIRKIPGASEMSFLKKIVTIGKVLGNKLGMTRDRKATSIPLKNLKSLEGL